MLGSRIEIEVTGVAHGGISVGRHEGRVVFVADAIPGERVLVEVTDDAKPSFWRADTVEVLEASQHRRPHVWAAASLDRPPADRAGGAEFGHITLEHQRELKRRVLVDALTRFGKTDLGAEVLVEALPSGDAGSGSETDTDTDTDGTGWRTRTRLQVDSEGMPGPFAARSHRVIRVDDLPLTVREGRSLAPLDERFPGASHVDIVVPSTGNPFVLVGEVERAPTRSGARRRAAKRPHQTRTPPRRKIVERVGDREFALDVRGFWQVHRHAAETLTAAVQQGIDPDAFDPLASNLDLYGGVGLLAAAVGDRFGSTVRITSVEADATATDHAAENLSDWVGASAVTDRVDRFVRTLEASAGPAERARLARGTVVLDPPRSGAGRDVIAAITAVNPAQIVYVACDPVALARDVATLAPHGYRLSGLRAFDLFPNTHHLEAVASFSRG